MPESSPNSFRARVAVALLVLGLSACARIAAAPVLGVDGSRLTVDGAPRFLVFVSYFDGLRAARGAPSGATAGSRLKSDLEYLAGKVDGIRVFPNWWDYGCPGKPAADTLMDVDGSIRATVWQDLATLLDEAAARQLLVDLSFSRESVGVPDAPDRRLTADAFARALTTLVGSTSYLKGRFSHALVDVQNEWPIHSDRTAIEALLASLREADPNRILAASSSGEAYAVVGARIPRMIAAFHDPRHRDWYAASRVEQAVGSVRTALGDRIQPIYLQEPMPASSVCRGQEDDEEPAHFVEAARHAQAAGAAAWTFHTRLSFDLKQESLVAKWNRAENRREQQAIQEISRIERSRTGIQ